MRLLLISLMIASVLLVAAVVVGVYFFDQPWPSCRM